MWPARDALAVVRLGGGLAQHAPQTAVALLRGQALRPVPPSLVSPLHP